MHKSVSPLKGLGIFNWRVFPALTCWATIVPPFGLSSFARISLVRAADHRSRRSGSIRRIRKISAHACDVEDQSNRQRKQKRIDPVEHSAVARQQGSRIFNACTALERGFHQVSQLSGQIDTNCEKQNLPTGRDLEIEA